MSIGSEKKSSKLKVIRNDFSLTHIIKIFFFSKSIMAEIPYIIGKFISLK